ncbi:hypothetical protein AKO1_007986 [Acrasis kona]|uniref:Uncharacterized protein n=1 Tax=Acrasis kona TaxID=1008807 RepID=A0AAW2YP88_9EUKA
MVDKVLKPKVNNKPGPNNAVNNITLLQKSRNWISSRYNDLALFRMRNPLLSIGLITVTGFIAIQVVVRKLAKIDKRDYFKENYEKVLQESERPDFDRYIALLPNSTTNGIKYFRDEEHEIQFLKDTYPTLYKEQMERELAIKRTSGSSHTNR